MCVDGHARTRGKRERNPVGGCSGGEEKVARGDRKCCGRRESRRWSLTRPALPQCPRHLLPAAARAAAASYPPPGSTAHLPPTRSTAPELSDKSYKSYTHTSAHNTRQGWAPTFILRYIYYGTYTMQHILCNIYYATGFSI